jgi:adenylate cyclase
MTDLISIRRLRFGSGLVLMVYIAFHLANHALGLVSLEAAERALRVANAIWQSVPGTLLLYGAAAVHVALALYAIYQRRTLRLPPIELLRIGLGLWLPVLLIGHAVSARLEHELLGSAASYTRIVASIWSHDGEWRQLGLLAPGWLHGVLGLRFSLAHHAWFRRTRLLLFSIALLLPVLSALGFVAMGRELAREGMPVAAQRTPSQEARVETLNAWRSGLLGGYVGLVGSAFAARGLRGLVERGRKRQITITYPGRRVTVPRGWSVLDASRAFHIPHASMCGGSARCSTCRVRIVGGADQTLPPDDDERATLQRIEADADVRLACRLRPQGAVSVVPLVDAGRPLYRPAPRRSEGARYVALLAIDVINRDALARDHIAEDLLFLMTRITDIVTSTVRATGGAISHSGHDSWQAVFGLTARSDASVEGTERAIRAAGLIDRALCDLDAQLGPQWACRAQLVISLHKGDVVVAETGALDAATILLAGSAYDEMLALRRSARTQAARFAVSGVIMAHRDGAAEDRFVDNLTELGVAWSPQAPPLWRTRAEQLIRS